MPWVRAIAAMMLLAVPGAGHAQPPAPASASADPARNAPPVLQSLRDLNAMLRRVPNASLSVNFAEWRLRVAIDKLLRLAEQWPAESPADYRVNLDRSVRTLDQALAAGLSDQLQALLEALADDLEIKLEHCTNSGCAPGGSVAVTVRTVQGDLESPNWQVFYLPKVLEAAGGMPDRFPQLSSPTLESLVPGRYVMWAREPDGALTGDRTVVKVGEGRQELLLDLAVPAGASR